MPKSTYLLEGSRLLSLSDGIVLSFDFAISPLASFCKNPVRAFIPIFSFTNLSAFLLSISLSLLFNAKSLSLSNCFSLGLNPLSFGLNEGIIFPAVVCCLSAFSPLFSKSGEGVFESLVEGSLFALNSFFFTGIPNSSWVSFSDATLCFFIGIPKSSNSSGII